MTTETHEADPASSQPHASPSDTHASDPSAAPPTQAATPSAAADSANTDATNRPNVDDHTTAEHTDPAAPPQKRMRIGSQRPGSPRVAAKPQFLSPAFIDSNMPAKTAPVPNIREKLSDEDEAELAEALEGMSLEEAVAPPAGALVALEPGTQLAARVVGVHRDSAFVDLGGGRQGAVPLRQFHEPPSVGTLFEVVIQSFDGDEGLYHATLPGGSVDVGDWSELAEGMIVEAVVTGMNKGGLECKVNNLRGFMPASQASDYRVEDLTQFFNQKLTCVVTECNPEKRNLVLSHRAVLERQKAEGKEKLQAELAEGQVREGVVRSLQDFGAFIDLGGLDGLLHVSQLSWQRVSHPRELLEVGQRVKVLVRKIDPASGKIGLSLRDLMDNPWSTVESRFSPTSIVTGKVVKVMDFGAFVELEHGIEGLVHISELSHSRVWRASDVVKPGDHVEVKVLSIDREKQRIALSIKAAQAAMPVKSEQPAEETEGAEEEAPAPIARPNVKLRGGIGRKSKGNQFGLKW